MLQEFVISCSIASVFRPKCAIFKSIHPFDLEVLDLVFGFVIIDKDCDCEHLASCVESTEGIFHVRSAGPVVDVERTRCIGLEE